MKKRCHNPYRSAMRVGIAAILAWSIIGIGCGKKGPPQLPDVKGPAGIRNLSASLVEEEIVLTWRPQSDKEAGEVAGYMVYSPADPADAKDCQGCPVLFKRVAQIPMASSDDDTPQMTHRELQMPGIDYRFKVVPYDEQGRMGPDSNIVRLRTD